MPVTPYVRHHRPIIANLDETGDFNARTHRNAPKTGKVRTGQDRQNPEEKTIGTSPDSPNPPEQAQTGTIRTQRGHNAAITGIKY